MVETLDWLAEALTNLREPDPGARPLTVDMDLLNAFGPFRPPSLFVEELNRRVFEMSRGTTVLTPGNESEFSRRFQELRTPQVAFLILSARKRVVLTANPDRPLEFDD